VSRNEFIVMKNVIMAKICVVLFCFISNSFSVADELHLSPYDILLKHYEAIGGLERLKKQKRMYSSGVIEFAELKGSFQYWSDYMLYLREETFSLFSQSEGDDGQSVWSKDVNGKILIHKDQETKKRRRIRALLEDFEHLEPESLFFDLHLIGLQKVKGELCYVVQLSNAINRDIILYFFSQSSFYLIKQIIKEPFYEFHSYFDDFRNCDDMIHAFYKKTSILPSQKIIIEQTEQLLIEPAIDKKLQG